MNPHIELVKKWLADNDSVSLEELEVNAEADYAAANAADYAAANAAYAADYAAANAAYAYYAAYYDAANAAYDAAAEAAEAAKYWVKRYEELTK